MTDNAAPIWVVGVGPGDPSYVTGHVGTLIEQAEVVAGFQLPLQTASAWIRGDRLLLDYRNQERLLGELVESAAAGRRCVVCAQGDPSFSGRELIHRVQVQWPNVQVVPGISSIQVVCARAELDLDECFCVTFHKRADLEATKEEFLSAAAAGRRHVLALPRPWDFMPSAMARFLLDGGVTAERMVHVYQHLTLPLESVVSCRLGDLAETAVEFSDLSIFVLPRIREV